MARLPAAKKTANTPAVTVPKSLEHWFLNPEHCIRLREILEDEVFQVAVATLKESAAPSAASISTDPQQNSHRLSWFAGYRDAFIDLAKLTKAPAKTTNTNDEWMHLLKP